MCDFKNSSVEPPALTIKECIDNDSIRNSVKVMTGTNGQPPAHNRKRNNVESPAHGIVSCQRIINRMEQHESEEQKKQVQALAVRTIDRTTMLYKALEGSIRTL